MKLYTKTSRYYVSAILLIFLVGGLLFFIALKLFINNDVAQTLYADAERVENKIMLDSVPSSPILLEAGISFIKVDTINPGCRSAVIDTFLIDQQEENEHVPAKALTFYAKNKLHTYKVTLIKSLVESDDLFAAIAVGLLILIILFLLALYYLNKKIFKNIWSPFYMSLQKIKNYDLNAKGALVLEASGIDEFNELNMSIEQMTNKIQADYANLKEFTENASHEIQTPLAIIKNKLELLIQADMKEDQMFLIQSINDAATRLSRLNQALLLLTKIENQQYQKKESVNLEELIQKHIDNYKELIEAKGLGLKTVISKCIITINPLLAEILIANIIANAIKHNVKSGSIIIELFGQTLTVSNTGLPLDQNPEKLFERFKKDKTDSESLGLGLAIVKKICETENIKIVYQFNMPIHQVTLFL